MISIYMYRARVSRIRLKSTEIDGSIDRPQRRRRLGGLGALRIADDDDNDDPIRCIRCDGDRSPQGHA